MRFILCGIVLGVILTTSAQAAQSVTLQLAKPGEAISPYIYGQFAEHLGHSIYGGMWAEMIEDRKFCFHVSDDYNPWSFATDPQWNTGPYKVLTASPWKVIGPAGTVTAAAANQTFVGDYTPQVHLPGNGEAGGILQEGLALVKGKTYTGHIVLAGDKTAGPVVVQILQDDGFPLDSGVVTLTDDFASHPIAFTATTDSELARISILSHGTGNYRIGTISLMPSDNIDGWRADTLACLKQLNIPIMRWPGGNFVSGYNWRDGIGERDKRPPRRNPAWHGVELNDVGIHEFMNLMSMLKCQVYLAVNTGAGSVDEAAAELQYVNGGPDTPMGKLRAQNGHPDPFNVKFVAVGNEMFGTWQIGYMPEAQYVLKHNQVVDALRKVTPDLNLTAVGDVGRDGGWDKLMLQTCADHMTLLSEHVYVKEEKDVQKHADLLPAAIQHVADAFRGYQKDIPQMQGKNIRIAMDEWNYWYGDYIYGELGVVYHLKDALGVARGLHAFYRNSDIFYMANYAQTVNVIGAIKANRTAASLESTGLVLAMYRAHFGSIPVPTNLSGTDFDVSAAWTDDKSELTVAIVNCTGNAETVALSAAGTDKLGTINAAKQWIITGSDAMSFNTPGKSPQVTLGEHDVQIINNTLPSPPLSVTLYRFKVGS